MPTNIADVEIFTAPILTPSSGDPRTAASVATAVQGLSNRTAYLRKFAMGSLAASIVVPLNPAHTDESGLSGRWLYDNTAANIDRWYQSVITDGGQITFPLHPGLLPRGVTITMVRIHLKGGFGAGHGGVMPASKPTLIFEEYDGSAETVAYTANTTDPTVVAATYDAQHSFDLTVSRTTPDEDTFSYKRYVIRVTGESGANSVANTLAINGLMIGWTSP